MDMGKDGIAGEPDLTEPGAYGYAVAGTDDDAAELHVTVLRFPAVAVIDDDAVAAFPVLDAGFVIRVCTVVRHAVAHAHDLARRGGEDPDAVRHGEQRRDADVDAVMSVVSLAAAAIVPRRRAGIAVEVVLDHAGLARLTIGRPA